MVEKLQGTDSKDLSKVSRFTEKEQAMNKMVYDYLKHHHMYYTMSVFASECLTPQQITRLDDIFVWNDILNSLGIHHIDKLCNPSRNQACKTQSLLDWMVETLGTFSNKQTEEKSSQSDHSANPTKLMLNSQSQTDICVTTQAIQTFFTTPNSAQTQTDDNNLDKWTTSPIPNNLNEEMVRLKEMLERSQSALQQCQSKLQDSENKIEQLMAQKNDRIREENNYSYPLQSRSIKLKDVRVHHNFGQRRVQEAFRFLDHVEDRLEYLDKKYQNAVVGDKSHGLARLLTDSHNYETFQAQ